MTDTQADIKKLQQKIDADAVKLRAAKTAEKRKMYEIIITENWYRLLSRLEGADKIDGLLVYEVLDYAFSKYDPQIGCLSAFLRHIYQLRLRGQIAESIRDKQLGGVRVSLTAVQKRIHADVNRLLKQYGSKLQLSGQFLEQLSPAEVERVADLLGYEGKQRAMLQETAELYQVRTEGLECSDADGEPLESPAELAAAMERCHEEQLKSELSRDIRDIFRTILSGATPIQQPYFRCFITSLLYDVGSQECLSSCLEFCEPDLVQRFEATRLTGQLSDAFIADYLQVGRGAVSKQRQRFTGLARRIYKERYKKGR